MTEPPPHLRLRLKTLDDVRVDLSRLYWAAKAGQIETSDASRLANLLAIPGRLIEGGDIEARLATLERRELES